ncbi:hypothetical protein TTRE_0000879901, partial [Trichuris trichiura]
DQSGSPGCSGTGNGVVNGYPISTLGGFIGATGFGQQLFPLFPIAAHQMLVNQLLTSAGQTSLSASPSMPSSSVTRSSINAEARKFDLCSFDRGVELKFLLNTHSMCFNLLTVKSPCMSRYKVTLKLRGLYSQTLSCERELESERIVWFPWAPGWQESEWMDLTMDCVVEAEAAREFSVVQMGTRNGFLLREPERGGRLCY